MAIVSVTARTAAAARQSYPAPRRTRKASTGHSEFLLRGWHHQAHRQVGAAMHRAIDAQWPEHRGVRWAEFGYADPRQAAHRGSGSAVSTFFLLGAAAGRPALCLCEVFHFDFSTF
jgi:hypothetical protein